MTLRCVCHILGYIFRKKTANANGFIETSVNNKKSIVSLHDAVKHVHLAYGTNKNGTSFRTCIPCYTDISDNSTLRYVIIIRPNTEMSKIKEADDTYPSEIYQQ